MEIEMTHATETPFIYLLNAMEDAARQEHPYQHKYAEKRFAVLDAVANLQSRLAAAEASRDNLLKHGLAQDEKLRPLIERAGCDPDHHDADIAIRELLNRLDAAESALRSAGERVREAAECVEAAEFEMHGRFEELPDWMQDIWNRRIAYIKESALPSPEPVNDD